MKKGHINMESSARKIYNLDMVRVGDVIENSQGKVFNVKENRGNVLVLLPDGESDQTICLSIDDMLIDPLYLTISIEKTINSLNKLIRLLPIMPVNVEELRMIYEHAREALIRA